MEQKMKLWYFAHPYTARDEYKRFVPEAEEANFLLCNYRAGRLLIAGYNVYSPISHTHPIHRATPEFLARHEHEMWYQLDIHFLDNTNFAGIILAPGWNNSKGCVIEKTWFEEHDREILYYMDIMEGT